MFFAKVKNVYYRRIEQLYILVEISIKDFQTETKIRIFFLQYLTPASLYPDAVDL